jgi:hypothetical protein
MSRVTIGCSTLKLSVLLLVTLRTVKKDKNGRHDIRHIDTQHNNIQHNNTQHNDSVVMMSAMHLC